MSETDDTTVLIRRQWNNHQIGAVNFSRLDRPHWAVISGGVGVRAPQTFIHAYVLCSDVEGEIAHSCLHGEGPHRIKIVVVRKDNSLAVWNNLLEVVGPKPITS